MSDVEKTAAPHNLDAEKAVLGAILISAATFFRVSPIVSEQDFFREAHRRIYAAMSRLVSAGVDPDAIALKSELGPDGLQRVGGLAFISSLTDSLPNIAQIEIYAEMIVREAKRRSLIATGNEIMRRAMEGEDAPEDIASEALSAFTATATRPDAQSRPFVDVIAAAYDGAEKRRKEDRSLALRSGLFELDSYAVLRRTFGVIGSPSKHGKSAYMMNLAAGLADTGHTVGVLTLESTPEEIAWRHIAATTGIAHGKVQDWRYLGAGDFERLARAQSLAKKLPIFMTRSVRTLTAIDAEARRLKAVHGLDALLIDYVQLVRHPGGPRDREERMAEIAARMLGLAIELDVMVCVTSQVNKDWMERKDRRLYPSDLKYAAAIGESARFVLLFQRPHVYEPETRSCQVLFQVAAANEGRTGDFEAHFDEATQKFGDGDCAGNNCRLLRNEPKEERLFA